MTTPKSAREVLEGLLEAKNCDDCIEDCDNCNSHINHALAELAEVVSEQELKGYLRVIRDDEGNDPFTRYQDAMCSKGYLLDVIMKAVSTLIARKLGGRND